MAIEFYPTLEYTITKNRENRRDAALRAYVDEPDTKVADICRRYDIKPANFAKLVQRYIPKEFHRTRGNAHGEEKMAAVIEGLEQGLTIEQVATANGVSKQYVAQLKRGMKAYDYLKSKQQG